MSWLKRIIVILCCIMILFSGRNLFGYFYDSYKSKQDYQKIADVGFSKKKEKDFHYDKLRSINKECVGWISIDGTRINYPIVKHKDNSFYLHHNFKKKSDVGGAIFMDYRNKIDASTEHLILYGHHMRNGSMFKALNRYKKKEFYKKHSKITMYIRDKKHTYDIAQVYLIDATKNSDYYRYVHKKTRKQQLKYLREKMSAHRIYDTGVKVNKTDELLSLSTCEYSNQNGRLIVLAKRRE